jgi:protein-S-isoprenylcysteine O-methyltransferase Ste14
MLRLLFFRAVVSLVVAGLVGGVAALSHPLFLAFLALEAALSLVEGWYSRGANGPQISQRMSRDQVPQGQFAFIMTGKWYLLARTIYQVMVLAVFAWRAATRGVAASLWNAAGLGLMIAGIALRAWSMATLGERFRAFEVRRADRGLETTGPYAMVRHPGYLALAMVDVAMPLVLSVPQMVVLVMAPVAIMLRRIWHEDELLASMYPDHAEYAARRRRIIPWIY